jgi:hypothetical protein
MSHITHLPTDCFETLCRHLHIRDVMSLYCTGVHMRENVSDIFLHSTEAIFMNSRTFTNGKIDKSCFLPQGLSIGITVEGPNIEDFNDLKDFSRVRIVNHEKVISPLREVRNADDRFKSLHFNSLTMKRGRLTGIDVSNNDTPLDPILCADLVSIDMTHCRWSIDFSLFRAMKRIVLDYTNIEDVSPLKDIEDVSLDGCREISDFSPLGRVKNLRVTDTRLRDLSFVVNIDTLDACRTEIRDPKLQGRIRVLNISRTHVEDVSTLGSVKSLDISHCRDINRGFLALRGVKCLTAKGTYLMYVSHLKEAGSLNLAGCKTLFDVSELASVPKLNLSSCFLIKKFPPFNRVKYLDLSHTFITGEDLGKIENVHALKLVDCTRVKDLSSLHGVKFLVIKDLLLSKSCVIDVDAIIAGDTTSCDLSIQKRVFLVGPFRSFESKNITNVRGIVIAYTIPGILKRLGLQ